MSKIISIVGLTEKTFTFRKNVSAVQIIAISGDGGYAVDIDTPKIVIYTSNINKAKAKTFTEKTSIVDLAEFGTMHRQRCITLGGLMVPVTIPKPGALFDNIVTSARLQVDLTDGVNGIQPLDGDDVTIELSELNPLTTYNVYAVEEDDVNLKDVNGNVIRVKVQGYKYELLSTKQEATSKLTDLKGVERLAIEKHAQFNSVEVGFKDGTNIKYTPTDLQLDTYDSFGDCYETNLVYYTSTGIDFLTKVEKEPRRNWVIPIDERVSYVQLNIDSVIGITPSIRVIALRTQVLND